MIIYKLEEVTKEYSWKGGRKLALNNISLIINSGDFITIQGESGAGKSTLLKMLETLIIPSSGEIYYKDKKLAALSSKEKALIRNTEIGMLLQDFPLMEKFDVLDNVRIPYYFSNMPIKEQENREKIILEKLGIAHLMKKSVKKLSGGERQRVSIARALVMDPQIIIADEPTSNLDAGNRDMFMGLMNELNKEGKTIIMASHDKEIIMNATKLITLKDGEIISE